MRDNNGSSYSAAHLNTLLADMIPARTLPAGANQITNVYFLPLGGGNRNINLSSEEIENGWPAERLENGQKGNRWLHSDMKDVAFSYTWKLFSRFSDLSHLEE